MAQVKFVQTITSVDTVGNQQTVRILASENRPVILEAGIAEETRIISGQTINPQEGYVIYRRSGANLQIQEAQGVLTIPPQIDDEQAYSIDPLTGQLIYNP